MVGEKKLFLLGNGCRLGAIGILFVVKNDT